MPIANCAVASSNACLKCACLEMMLVSGYFYVEVRFCWA